MAFEEGCAADMMIEQTVDSQPGNDALYIFRIAGHVNTLYFSPFNFMFNIEQENGGLIGDVQDVMRI